MSWKQIEKPRTVLASKALVKEFAEMDPAPYDRPLSERRLLVYRRILKNGEFRTVTWASAVCQETNNTYRVNGKHTSMMLAGLDPLPEFHVTVERYECETLQDVGKLYNTFDSNLASRTTADINLSFARTIPELSTLGPKLINTIVAALSMYQWDDAEIRKIPPAERAEQLLDNIDFCKWTLKILPPSGVTGRSMSSNLSTRLCRSPVVWAMRATYEKAPRLAEQFWLEVRDEINADRDNPTRVLARFLLNAVLGGSAGRMKGKIPVTSREVYAKSIHAWNAWRRGETTRLAYFADADLPVPVK